MTIIGTNESTKSQKGAWGDIECYSKKRNGSKRHVVSRSVTSVGLSVSLSVVLLVINVFCDCISSVL